MKFIMLMFTIVVMNNHMKMFSMSLTVLMLNLSLQNFKFSKMSLVFLSDHLSFWLMNLSLWIMLMVVSFKMKKSSAFVMLMTTTALSLTITFSVWNFMAFYIMFEIMMIMVFIFIIMWGYQPERLEASLYMIFFTLFFSTPFFFSINLSLISSDFSVTWVKKSIVMYLGFMMVFMVKLPLFFIHLWLPKAHVESPTFGSMILAAIMLKLGGYGIIRMEMSVVKFMEMNNLFMATALWSAVVLSTVCLMQNDLKTIIAYSSIVHMMIMLTNLIMYKQKSVMGGLVIMIGHGLTSSALFFALSLSYNMSKSRSSIINKGILETTPHSAALWFILCMSNAPMPPSVNMLGEIMCMKSILTWNPKLITLMVMLMMVSAMYSIYMFYIKNHSHPSTLIKTIHASSSHNMTVSSMHIFPLLSIMIKPMMLNM